MKTNEQLPQPSALYKTLPKEERSAIKVATWVIGMIIAAIVIYGLINAVRTEIYLHSLPH